MLIHPSHQPEAKRALRAVGVLLALLVVALLAPQPLKPSHIDNYSALHTALETLATMVAGMVFAIAWSVRRERLSRNVVLLGVAFLGVALLNLAHTLSGHGMPVFITPSTSDKAIYFWLAARSLGTVALLAAAWLPWRASRHRRMFPWLVAGVLALVGVLMAVYFLEPAARPRFFVPGQGLSTSKVTFESVLMALDLLAAARFYAAMRKPRTFDASGLFAAACILAEGSVFFVLYASVTGVYILVGHVYKVLAYVYLYRAIFAQTVRQPYALLRDSRQQLKATLDAIPDLLFEMDAGGRYLDVHTSSPAALAATSGSLVGKTLGEVLAPADAQVALNALDEARRTGVSRGHVIAVEVAGGGTRWFELSIAVKPAPDADPPRFVVISHDVTARRQAEATLRKLSAAVEQNPLSIIMTDVDGRIEYVNAAFTRTTGYTRAEAVGQQIHALLGTDQAAGRALAPMWDALRRGQPWHGEFVNRSKDGREHVEAAAIYPVRGAAGAITGYISHQEDVTERKLAAERIRRLSHYDQVTGLPNRTMLHQHFVYAASRARPTALLWIDLDRFKEVNDTLGHAFGDMVLQELTRRLLHTLPPTAMPSRHTGDEFIVVVPDTDQAGVARLAQTLLHDLSEPMLIAGEEVFISVSIGIALHPDDADRLEGLLGRAEIALYRAKEEGRNDYRFFTPAMQQRTTRLLALGNALKLAQQRGELHLVYQPQVALASGRIVGAEALLRWDSPQWGAVAPMEFIPIAEANSLIVPIGEWVLRTALTQLRRWQDRGLSDLTLAVNLSGAQFDRSDLGSEADRLLEASGAPAGRLEFELTEAVAMRAPARAARQMEVLSRRHIGIAIDDFGTGYSSLSYLKQFPIKRLKIDQSFVRDIGHDADDQAITVAIIQLARGLGIETIAEGVETAEQLAFLRARGCDQVQGFYYSRPLPPDEFECFVRAWRGTEPVPDPAAG